MIIYSDTTHKLVVYVNDISVEDDHILLDVGIIVIVYIYVCLSRNDLCEILYNIGITKKVKIVNNVT